MATKGIRARELYEALSSSPQQRRTIAERIFRQLRDDGGRTLSDAVNEKEIYAKPLRTRPAS